MVEFFRSRFYDGESDLVAVLALVAAANTDQTRTPYWHVGDVLWQMFRGHDFDAAARIRLWHTDDGALAGFAWRDAAGSAVLQQHPAHYQNRRLEDAMLRWVSDHWAEPVDDGRTHSLTTYALDSDRGWRERLISEGFIEMGEHLMCRMERELSAPIPETAPPDGAVIRPIDPESELAERVALHRDVWTNSAVTADSYRRMRSAPGYVPDLDIVATMPDGAFASYCVCWFDPVSARGEFEPVGTRAAYRRQGLGRAVVYEGVRRLQARGARSAIVYGTGTNLAAQALYVSAGFRITDRERAYRRIWFRQ